MSMGSEVWSPNATSTVTSPALRSVTGWPSCTSVSWTALGWPVYAGSVANPISISRSPWDVWPWRECGAGRDEDEHRDGGAERRLPERGTSHEGSPSS
jgi:hypothetical protein